MLGCSKQASWAFVAVSLSLSSIAAAVTQPNGTTVPVLNTSKTVCADNNIEVCLDDSEGDPALIDSQKDAIVAPETFQPTCQLTFTPIVKGGSISDVFGWYNVREDPTTPGKFLKPTQAELYGMFYATGFKTGAELAAVPPVVLDLGVEAAAGRYKGGQIGFFLVSTDGQISIDPVTHAVKGDAKFQFYTQHALNVGSTPTMTFYNVLTWESQAKKNTFYFGWEDLPPTAPIDNDFDDFLFSVSGVQCGGGGQPCETGMMGVCSAGVLQCKKGVIACVQSLQPADEACNALDDDCNGEVDEGDNLCGASEVCSAGVCVPKCGTGEFRCPAERICNTAGVCVEAACKEVSCPAGKVCSGGECVDSCTGIECPHGRTCRNGGCVDPCVGIECDDGFACVLGVCTSCECSACTDGAVCAMNAETSGAKLCVDSGCEDKTCTAGTHCKAGECVDNCSGVVCPAGQACAQGECVADGSNPGGGSGPGSGIGGLGPLDPGGLDPSGLGGSGGSKAGGNGNAGGPVTTDQKSCNCSVPGGNTSGGALALALSALALAMVRRRRAA
jgi:MYXO-CTERM domain-containing protein